MEFGFVAFLVIATVMCVSSFLMELLLRSGF
jgi:hypothetical protein